jgi:hypothetical protein
MKKTKKMSIFKFWSEISILPLKNEKKHYIRSNLITSQLSTWHSKT